MKFSAILALMVLASASGLPRTAQRADAVDIVDAFIMGIRSRIVAAGLDPYSLDSAEYEFELLGNTVRAFISEVSLTGISNIAVDAMDYSYDTNLFTYDFAIPEVHGSIGEAKATISAFGYEFTILLDGTLYSDDIRITGECYVVIDDSGATASNLTVSSSLGALSVDIHFNIFGYDVSTYVNSFINDSLPTILNNYKDTIDSYLGDILLAYVQRQLSA